MRRSPLLLGVLIAIIVVAAQALLVPLFAGPAISLEPRHLPIAIAGPPAATAPVAAALRAQHPGAFRIRVVDDAESTDALLKHREVYGGIVLEPGGPVLHLASAGSPAVAALLTQATTSLGRGRPVPVRDIVPADPDDPRGAGFASGFLPLALTALLAGILIFLRVPRRGARVAGVLSFAVLAGLTGAAVQQYWLGLLAGSYAADAIVIALFSLAVAGTIAGLGAVLGRIGLAIGVLAVFLVGNPLSALAAAPELLPRPWGELGQLLPVGAGGTALRSVAWFGGDGGVLAILVLLTYACTGLLLAAAGRRGLDTGPAGDEPAAEPAPATAPAPAPAPKLFA